MKQILQRRIDNINKTIPILDNDITASIYADRRDMLIEIGKEYTSLQKIKTNPRRSKAIKYLFSIFGELFEYQQEDLLNLMLVHTDYREEELINFLIEIRPPDIEDWKQENPNWKIKYF